MGREIETDFDVSSSKKRCYISKKVSWEGKRKMEKEL